MHAVLRPGVRGNGTGLRQDLPHRRARVRLQGGHDSARRGAHRGPQVARIQERRAVRSAGSGRHARDVRVAARRPAADLQRSAQGSADQPSGGAVERRAQADHVAGSRPGRAHGLFALRNRGTEGDRRGLEREPDANPFPSPTPSPGAPVALPNATGRWRGQGEGRRPHEGRRSDRALQTGGSRQPLVDGDYIHPACLVRPGAVPPGVFFLTNLFGGGTWTRILHPYIGVVLAVSFYFLVHRFFADNLMTPADWAWVRGLRYVITNEDEKLPEVGRFNAGQKLLFWVM